MTMNKLLKRSTLYLAWTFLGLFALIISVTILAGTNWGLRLAAHLANQSESIQISEISGGLFTSATIGVIHVDIPDGLELKVEQAQLDIGINCLLDLRACLNYVVVERIHVYLPPSTEQAEPQASEQSVIELPLALTLDMLKVSELGVFQKVDTQRTKIAGDAYTLLKVHQIDLRDFQAHQSFVLSSLNVDELLLFVPPASMTAQNQSLQVSSGSTPSAQVFSLSNIPKVFASAPQFALPDIFIPLNAELKQFAVNKICWQLAQEQDKSAVLSSDSCISELNLAVKVQEQDLDAKLSVQAHEVLKANGVDAQSVQVELQLNAQNNWRHEAQIMLLKAASPEGESAETDQTIDYLALLASGDLDKTSLQLLVDFENAQQTLVQSALSADLDSNVLPLDVQLQVNDLSPINGFLTEPLAVLVSKANISFSGDWLEYKINMSAQLMSALEEQSGLSSLRLIASASPQALRFDVVELATEGLLGETLANGKVTLDKTSAILMLESQLAISLKRVNLAALGLDMNSDINGEFSVSHEYTDQWMRADLLCKDVNGQVQGNEFGMDCDVALSKSGQLNIRSFSLTQEENTLEANGKLVLPSTEYATLNLEKLMETQGNISLDINLPQLSVFQKGLNGQIDLQGNFEGSLGAPLLTLSSDIVDLNYLDIGLEQGSLELKVDAANNYETNLELNLAKLAIGTNVINSAGVNLQGNQAKHTLALNVQAKDISTEHRLEGALELNETSRAWSGNWNKAIINLPFTRISLADDVDIEADLNTLEVGLSDHCWTTPKSEQGLCLKRLKYSDGNASGIAELAYDIAIALRHYSPEIVLAESRLPLSSNITFDYNAKSGLSAKAYNRVIGGEIETESHLLELTAIVANMTVEQNILRTTVFAGSQTTGVLGLKSKLNLAPDNRIHTASVRVTDFDLSLLQRFIPSTHSILGMVNADVAVNGELLEPQLDGYVNIDGGELILDAYTYPLTKFSQSITFEGQQASVRGAFNLGKGEGKYNADIELRPELIIKGGITGTDLQFAYQNNTAQISPNLNFALSPTELNVKGDVAIPSADIQIKDLPENARTPSSDTIIIGQKAPDPIIPLALDIGIKIIIDKPKRGFVVINALDLEAKLAGDLDLNISQKRRPADNSLQPMRTLLNGQIDIIEGSYEAYGQMLLVQSGKIFFSGEPSLPQFNIRAIRNPLNTEGDVIAGVQISGNPVLPRVELFSEPPMIQAKQLSYLLQGQDITAKSDGSGGIGSDTALINMLVNFGVGRSENRVGQFGRALGFDSLNVGTAGAGDNTQVQISGRISENIQITYGIGVFDAGSVVSLKYQLLPQLFIEAKSGLNSSLDLFYQVSSGENN